MTYQNRTIIVERNSADLTTRVIQALDGYDDVAQAAADAQASADSAATAATNAEGASVDAVAAADAAVAASKFFFADKATMLASVEVFSVGDQLLTRKERAAYTVVSSSPDETTAGGVMLQKSKGGFFLGVTPYFRPEGEDNDGTLRIPQRAFIGAHSNFYGALSKSYNDANGSGYTWIKNTKTDPEASKWLIDRATVSVTTDFNIAFSALSRSAQDGRSAFGLVGMALLDGPASTGTRHGWGLYTESFHRVPASGVGGEARTHGAEFAVINTTADFGAVDPYMAFPTDMTTGITVNCGVAPSEAGPHFPAQWAFRITSVNSDPGSRFHTGILIRQNTLVADAGGFTKAIQLPDRAKIQWFGAASSESAYIATDQNNNLWLATPGGGKLRFSYAASAATAPGALNPNRIVELIDGAGNTVYVAGSNSPW